ncbi:hypothetical protein JQ557_16415 [Bradyrhizobium sp. U87765 SZCCT0131]|uniref:hypothetical protein n=1 Tax=unclassified Bradyrhizobium TaxID=2631580 RepID=UPI001BAC8BB8|nr:MULTISPECIES: hypothetical protein [unclassified Bradyrhizobium]MBR1219591.1 hypothetical protein [Bradyrhizobium sp. U87765 SZCCT0131]MBR1262242.1 hypothetical protein [Bradyrhizobium sp. U87765 SZCCT0134]MBR1308575.1 hypothetical protein [Bradyrhizobium sp. U87765 SZCCT0110]MBR1318024.1 hypothetical protein [Bradyrhizobium sp. U87765 SZCCT0109]MBR1351727.1 hypothetical protein [Bradyrhizobium sp. U87765 SZCCT0048]
MPSQPWALLPAPRALRRMEWQARPSTQRGLTPRGPQRALQQPQASARQLLAREAQRQERALASAQPSPRSR